MKLPFLNPNFEINLITEKGFDCVVGLDEVGRGAWAGPVAVGAYIITKDCKCIDGIQDSKQLKLSQREECYSVLSQDEFIVEFGEVELIDKIGIGKTIENLISRIINQIRKNYNSPFFIIDGQFSHDFGLDSIKKTKADSTYYCVAAASILAKVERDRLMKSLHFKFPEYGFDTNVGYPTKRHIKGLNRFGITSLHRTSYAPIADIAKLN